MKSFKFILLLLLTISKGEAQSFDYKEGDDVYTCFYVIDLTTQKKDQSIERIIKRVAPSEFIVVASNKAERHYSIKKNFYSEDVLKYETISDKGIKCIFSIIEKGEGMNRSIDVTCYSDMPGNSNFAYAMRAFNYFKYNSKEIAQEKQEEEQKIKEKEETVFTIVEEMPDFPGGNEAMNKYILENIKFPQKAKDGGLSNVNCYVTFIIEKDGKLKDIKILRGIPGCEECDIEALRVINSMPIWQPGKQNGSSVRVQYNLGIKFK